MNSQERLEQDLARVGQLMNPREGFVDRVMQQVDLRPEPIVRRHFNRWWIPAGLAAAASVLISVGLFVSIRGVKNPIADPSPRLVRSSSSEWQTISEQPVTLTGDVPARLISRQLFDRVKWTDPQQHATFERMVPREKVTLITLENY